MTKINSATFVQEVTIVDPQTKGNVTVSIFKHDQSGGIFGVDSSFIEQSFDDDETAMIADPFNNNSLVELSYI
jgi:putative methionine-R-sulfoxide reductase with GAF domain